ncbi:MAG TPA: thioesterase [Myxococcales bacterium]|nr:thioesterase [Deltaproteobacteria bacterium]HAA56949.1 thioesterase [Myxococcales bacterium]|tara:strand:- start:4971 stop:5381 length:411 start_codon:yes stop_codon:yes gene_type:complete
MSSPHHTLDVQIYYEDTDFTGAVYHANYLKYFERAREHLLGVDALVDLYREQGVGFVVYKVDITYKEPASHGDILHINTDILLESPYRVVFHQSAVHSQHQRLLVYGRLELVCVNKENKLVRVPEHIYEGLQALIT